MTIPTLYHLFCFKNGKDIFPKVELQNTQQIVIFHGEFNDSTPAVVCRKMLYN